MADEETVRVTERIDKGIHAHHDYMRQVAKDMDYALSIEVWRYLHDHGPHIVRIGHMRVTEIDFCTLEYSLSATLYRVEQGIGKRGGTFRHVNILRDSRSMMPDGAMTVCETHYPEARCQCRRFLITWEP